MQARVPRGVLTELKRFFYDTAWSAHPMALASLTRLVPTSQVLFGSDYPYRTGEDHVKGLMESSQRRIVAPSIATTHCACCRASAEFPPSPGLRRASPKRFARRRAALAGPSVASTGRCVSLS